MSETGAVQNKSISTLPTVKYKYIQPKPPQPVIPINAFIGYQMNRGHLATQDEGPRKQIFSLEERKFIEEAGMANLELVSIKSGDATSRALRKQLWDKITLDFNSQPGFNKRNEKQLRKLWMNMRSEQNKRASSSFSPYEDTSSRDDHGSDMDGTSREAHHYLDMDVSSKESYLDMDVASREGHYLDMDATSRKRHCPDEEATHRKGSDVEGNREDQTYREDTRYNEPEDSKPPEELNKMVEGDTLDGLAALKGINWKPYPGSKETASVSNFADTEDPVERRVKEEIGVEDDDVKHLVLEEHREKLKLARLKTKEQEEHMEFVEMKRRLELQLLQEELKIKKLNLATLEKKLRKCSKELENS